MYESTSTDVAQARHKVKFFNHSTNVQKIHVDIPTQSYMQWLFHVQQRDPATLKSDTKWRNDCIPPISCGSKRVKSRLSIGVLLLAIRRARNSATVMGFTLVKLSILSVLRAENIRASFGMPWRSASASVVACSSVTETRDEIIWMKPRSYSSNGRPNILSFNVVKFSILHPVNIRTKEVNMHGRNGLIMLWMEIENWSDGGSGIVMDVPMLGRSL